MSKKLLKTSFYFTALSTVASAVNFAFYPFISHLLSVATFGDVQIGVSFIMLAASLLTSLSTLALFTSANGESERSALRHVERLIIATSIACSILIVAFAQPIASLLQLQDPSLLYILAGIFILNIPASTSLGALQGGDQFLASGFISTVSSLIKLLAALVFIFLGWGGHGALLGIATGTFIILPLAKVLDKANVINFKETFSILRVRDVGFFAKRLDLLGILASLILIAFIANIDILTSKILLSPSQAGAYAQLSTAGKIPYFAGLPIALVLFERFIRKNINRNLSIILYSAIVFFIGITVVVCSDPLLRLLFNYQGSSTAALPLLVVAFSSYSVVTLAAYRLIAQHQIKRLCLLAFVSVVTVGSITLLAEPSSTDISRNYMLSILAMLPLSIGITYTRRHE